MCRQFKSLQSVVHSLLLEMFFFSIAQDIWIYTELILNPNKNQAE